MSSLTLSLLLLGVLVALAVVAHSLWILYRERSRGGGAATRPVTPPVPPNVAPAGSTASAEGDSLAPEPHLSLDDVLDEPPEGSAGPLSESVPAEARPAAQAGGVEAGPTPAATPEPGRAGTPVASAPPMTVPSAAGPAPAAPLVVMPPGVRVLHDDADCLVELPLLQATSGDRLLTMTKSIRRAGGKPVAFEGLPHMPGMEQGAQLALPTEGAPPPAAVATPQWEALRHGVSYRRLRAGILLSNRQGPLNAMEFSEFSARLQALGSQLGVPVELPEMNATLQRARALDNLLADCDVQLGLAVDCAKSPTPADLAALARRLGLLERGNNRYACLSESGEVIYTIALGDKAQRLQLMFDVPRVHPAHQPWWKMAEAAHQAALQFQGSITDDGGRELSEQSFRNVAIALEGRQQALAEAGVPAGSALALRVFN